jgi:hypothetical protein
MGRPYTSRPLVGPSGHLGRMPATKPVKLWYLLLLKYKWASTLSCGRAGVGQVGVYGGADRRAAQKPGHVVRHALGGCFRGDSRFGRIRTIDCELKRQLGFCGSTYAATITANVIPPSGESSCWSPEATCSTVAFGECCSSGVGQAPVAVRRVVRSDESAEQASSVAFRFSAGLAWPGLAWPGLAWPIPQAACVFFISSIIIGAIALTKLNSSCVGIWLSAGALLQDTLLRG